MSQAKKDNPGYYGDVKLMPTPQPGDRVWWFDRADKSQTPIAADVVLVEAPGRVCLKLITRRPYRKATDTNCLDGVRHTSDDCHKVDNANTRDHGGWDWHRGVAPADALDAHRKELERKEEMRLKEAIEAEQRIALRKEMAAA